MKLLFINSCVGDKSRTLNLCRKLLDKFRDSGSWTVDEINLEKEALRPFNSEMLKKRDEDFKCGNLTSCEYHMAREFADADMILIGAPYWDCSFPSALKVFFEHICVNGIAFAYSEEGQAIAKCRAKTLLYISTAGGYVENISTIEQFISDLCKLLGISDIRLFIAKGLDIQGNDVDTILKESWNEIEKGCCSLI